MVLHRKFLKLFKVAELKKIIKKHGLGRISKKKKIQLISMILDCDQCDNILQTLEKPIKVFSKAQLANQQRFKDMVSNKKQLPKRSEAKIKAIADMNNMRDMKNILKECGSDKKCVIKGIDKEISKVITNPKTGKKKEDLTDNNMKKLDKLETIRKKVLKTKFLDDIFGIRNPFDFSNELDKILEELQEDKLMNFLSKNHKDRNKLLRNRFDKSKSLTRMIKNMN